jgi:hypothetical protein
LIVARCRWEVWVHWNVSDRLGLVVSTRTLDRTRNGRMAGNEMVVRGEKMVSRGEKRRWKWEKREEEKRGRTSTCIYD